MEKHQNRQQKQQKMTKKVRKPSTFYLYWREVLNYIFIKRTINKQKKLNSPWYSLNLRADWVGRIYTVVNLRKEDLGEEEMIQRVRIGDMIKPINTYLRSLDLHEIIYPAIEKISEQSYLVVYSPLLEKLTFWRTMKYLLVLGMTIALIWKILYYWVLPVL